MFKEELRAFSEGIDRYLPAGAEGASLAGQYRVAKKKVWIVRIPYIGLIIAWALAHVEWLISTYYYNQSNFLHVDSLLLLPFLIMNTVRPYIERRFWRIENQIMLKRMESFAKIMQASGIDGFVDNSPESTKTAGDCAAFFDLARSVETILPAHVKGHQIFGIALITPFFVFLVLLLLSVTPMFQFYPRLEILWAILFICTFIATFTEIAIAVSLAKVYVKVLIVQGDLPLNLVESMKYAVEHDALLIFQLYQRGGADALKKGWKRPTRRQRRELRYNDIA